MQIDDIIKNPKRSESSKTEFKQYVPEYVRLGVTPVEQNTVGHLPDDIQNNFEYIENDSSDAKYPQIGELVLMVYDKVVDCGSREHILALAKSILYGEHPEYVHEKISVHDIIVLKRLSLRAGVFIE